MADRLAQWLTEQLVEAVARVELRYKGQEPVFAVAVPRPLPEGWAARVAVDVNEAAAADAEQFGDGHHRYSVQLHGAGARPASFPVHVKIAHTDATGLDIDQPNGRGVLSQMMKLVQNLHTTSLGSFEVVAKALGGEVKRLSEENARLVDERLSTIKTVEEFLSMHHDRELAAKEAESRIALRDRAITELKPLASAVVARLSGQSVKAAVGGDPQMQAVADFLSSLTDQQKAKLAGELSPAQLAAMGELLNAFQN